MFTRTQMYMKIRGKNPLGVHFWSAIVVDVSSGWGG
jgi:hypothetical protein